MAPFKHGKFQKWIRTFLRTAGTLEHSLNSKVVCNLYFDYICTSSLLSFITELMDQDYSESPVNLLTLPTELLVFITSLLCSLREKVKLRYVSRWLRCVVEGTPSLWKEFVWRYYDSREEYSLKEVLKVCGKHIKLLAFPNFNRAPSIILQMLKYCSNVQHLSLSSTVFDHEQLRKAIHHMGHLETLEIKIDSWNVEQLLVATSHLRTHNV